MKFSDSEPENTSIEITPLIDVVFLLLIFFMISTTFTREAVIEVNLPEVSEQPKAQEESGSFELHISSESYYALQKPDQDTPSLLRNRGLDTLRQALAGVAEPDVLMVIHADRNTPHEAVVQAMDVAGKLGIQRMSFAINQAAEEGL